MRRKIMGFTIPPWYQAMPVLGMLASGLGLVVTPVIMMYLRVDTEYFFARSIGLAYFFTAISIFVLMVCWSMWVAPWFASGDPDYAPTKPPREVGRELEGVMSLFTVIVWCFTALAMAYIVIIGIWSGRHRIGLVLIWAVVGISIGAVPLLWVIPISRRVRQRVRDTARRRCVCFACGYDLRGNPAGACPECGHRDSGSESA